MLRESARVETIEHNDLDALEQQLKAARAEGELPVYVADSVYSMGGRCPIADVLKLAEKYDAKIYLDDAHGTSIFGPRGEGAVFEALGGLRERIVTTFSLSKGFGTNGGGVLVPSSAEEDIVRLFGQSYAFSASLDFSAMGAAMAALELHLDGTVSKLQARLRDRVARFDALMPNPAEGFSPIRMVKRASTESALVTGEGLIERGYFVTVALFPVVPRENPQLRVCLAVDHTDAELDGLCAAISSLG